MRKEETEYLYEKEQIFPYLRKNWISDIFVSNDEATIFLFEPLARIFVVFARPLSSPKEILNFDLWDYAEMKIYGKSEKWEYEESLEYARRKCEGKVNNIKEIFEDIER
ncbi:MAG: hypothetical protein QXP36_12865 [Conexivisphaerales archaeon]